MSSGRVTICHRRPSQLALGAQVVVWWRHSVGSDSPESPETMWLARAPFSQLLTLPSDQVRAARGEIAASLGGSLHYFQPLLGESPRRL